MNSTNIESYFEYNKSNIFYGKKGSGPDLVLVHGTPWSSYNMRHIINILSSKYTVYYYDLLGYGNSDKNADDISLGVQNKVLSSLLEYWNLKNPIIVGHDFGGTTTLRSLLLDNKSFRKIVLINPVALSPWGSSFFNYVKKNEAIFADLPDYIHESIVRSYISSASYIPLNDETMNNTVSPWLGTNGKSAFYRQMAQSNEFFTDEIERLYENINIPVLILWGKEDTWIPYEKGVELYRKIPNSSLSIIDEAGHLIIEEKPMDICKKIISFLI